MKKFGFIYILIFLFFFSCKANIDIQKYDVLDIFRTSYRNMEQNKKELVEKSIKSYLETLSDEEKISQMFLISLDGNSSSQVERIFNTNRNTPGGYLLFAFNIPDSAEKTIDFLSEINDLNIQKGSIPPYISIDHEGGVVNRLRNICSKLPSQQSVARKFTENEAEKLYELHGKQLKNLGIHVNLAPVVEVLTEENILFLDDRSYGNLNDVLVYSNAQISGMKKSGILPVLKHFPGNTNNDPHTGLPILECSIEELKDKFITPFRMLNIKEENSVLVSHTLIPAVDEKPACLSEKVINMLTENAVDYDGLLFSDDLLMKALIKNGYPVEKSLIDAVDAGINILMISSGKYDEYAEIIIKEYETDESFKEKVDRSVQKILEWKTSCNLLERKITQTGFFEYTADIYLHDSETETERAERLEQFQSAYDEASALYNDVWWTR